MESFVIKTLESADTERLELTLPNNISALLITRCNLGYISPNYVKDVISFFDQLAPKENTVGTKAGNEIVSTACVSRSIAPVKFINNDKVLSFKHLNSIYPDIYREIDFEHHITQQLSQSDFQLHCYGPGGFFVKHSDGKKAPRHFGTLLLFPPATMSPFEGGNLILYPDNMSPIYIEPSKFTKWTIVAFTLNVAHECTEVTSGQRFVFKTELNLPNDNLFFSNSESSGKRVPINLDSALARRNAKIAQLKEKIEHLAAGKVSPKVNNLLKQIESTDGNVCVVLQTDQASTDPILLEGEEAILWNHIVERWPYSSLQVKDTAHCRGDGSCEPSSDLDLSDEYDNNECSELGSAKIIYWKSPKNHRLGKLNDTRSEYNDSTYDTFYDLTVTLICVQKEQYLESSNEPETTPKEVSTSVNTQNNTNSEDEYSDFNTDLF